MEVLVGSSFTIDVSSSSSSFVSDRTAGSPPPDSLKSRYRSFQSEIDRKEIDDDFHSDSSSSIGDPDDDSDNETVSSNGRFAALKSLEESLPIKRGLSNHFSGKSKSFVNLAEANSVSDIEKPENPLNKRRRILIATKWIRKSAFYSFPNPKSMPLLALKEEEEEEEEGPFNDEDEYEESRRKGVIDFHKRKLMSFKSRSCFSLMDLQHHDEQ